MYLQKDLPQSIFKQLKTLGKSEITMELISDKTNVRFKRLNILERIVKNVKKKRKDQEDSWNYENIYIIN